MNNTIIECVRYLRSHAIFPLYLWVNYIDTIIYLINKGPCTAFDGEILEETLIGKFVNYSFHKFFVYEDNAYIDKEYRKKLDAKS